MSKKTNGTFPVQIAINSRAVAEMIADRLRAISLPAKAIARRTVVTPRTVEDWLSGENAPNAAAMIRLMSEFDEVYEAVNRMAGRTPLPTLSPEKKRAMAEIAKLLGEA